MAVSGLPEPCHSHALCIARLALDMMDLAADEVQIDGEPVVCTYTSCLLIVFCYNDYGSDRIKRLDNVIRKELIE